MTRLPLSASIALLGFAVGPIVAITDLVISGLQSPYGISPFAIILVPFFTVLSAGSALLAIALRLLVRWIRPGIAGEIVCVVAGSVGGLLLAAFLLTPSAFSGSWDPATLWLYGPIVVLMIAGSVAGVLVCARTPGHIPEDPPAGGSGYPIPGRRGEATGARRDGREAGGTSTSV